MFYWKDKITNFVYCTSDEKHNKNWVEITEAEFNETLAKNSAKAKIVKCKNELAKTDYLLFKHLEGYISNEEYAEIKERRQELRDEINRLEAEIKL